MAKKTAKSEAKPKKAASKKRVSWLNKTATSPMIAKYAKQMTSFAKAMADGVIDDAEIKEQEARVTALMKEIEPQLDDELHAKVTELLCECAVYDTLQMLHSLQSSRPVSGFRG